MRRALPLAAGVIIAFAAMATSYGDDVVSFDFIPDVILGDNVTADGQSGDNYYSYDALYLGQYVLDEDTTSDGLRVGFWVSDEGRVLSINGFSRMTMEQLVEFDVNKVVPDHKDVYATSTMRGTSDHWNATDNSITQFTPALGGNFGPHFGFGVWPNFDDDATFVQLLGTDGSSTATAGFWVILADNQPSSVTGGALTSIVVDDPAGNPLLNGGNFTFFGYRNRTPADGYVFGVVRSGFLGFDTVTMDSSPNFVAADEIGFAAWQNTNFAYGDLAADEWIDGLIRVGWAVSADNTNADEIPGIRSRMRPGMPWDNNPSITPSDIPFTCVHSAQRLSAETGLHPNTAQMVNDTQINFRHYFYHPYIGGIQGYYPSLWLALDTIDIPDAWAGGRVLGGRIDIDRVFFNIIPKPGTDPTEVTNLLDESNAGLHQNMTAWGAGVAGIDLDPNRRLGGFVVDQDPDGLTVRSASSTYIEQRVFGWIEHVDMGIKIADTQGDLIRFTATINQDDVTSAPDRAKVDLRLRVFAEYREPTHTLYIPQFRDDGDPLTTEVTTFVAPVTTGTTYEVYMETPLPAGITDPANADSVDDWGIAMDVINYYHPDPAINAGYNQRMAANVTLNALRVDRIAKY